MFKKTIPQKHLLDKESETEYCVYTHGQPEAAGGFCAPWERKIATKSKLRAFAKARRLFASNDYQKVEIKKKVSLGAGSENLDQTVKIYKKAAWDFKPSRLGILLAGILLGMLITCVVAYSAYALNF